MIDTWYNFKDKTVVITGGAGVLGAEMAAAVANRGANVAVVDLNTKLSDEVSAKFDQAAGMIKVFAGDVLDKSKLMDTKRQILEEFGRVDALINGAGGNSPKATTGDLSFFDLPKEAIDFVMQLNLQGAILPSQVFGALFAEQDDGNIINVSSMNAFRPLTRIPGYSAAKAAVSNFTQWLAVHMAQEYSTNIRVNAIAPGFFLTQQNRFLLTDEKTGELTPRGKSIIDHTPMGKFGSPKDLTGALLWLLSPASEFVTGIILPIDGGFSAFSGV